MTDQTSLCFAADLDLRECYLIVLVGTLERQSRDQRIGKCCCTAEGRSQVPEGAAGPCASCWGGSGGAGPAAESPPQRRLFSLLLLALPRRIRRYLRDTHTQASYERLAIALLKRQGLLSVVPLL